MDDELLADRFEGNRARLRAMAYRMLGSASDAEDAVQEAWLRAARAGADGVANLDGWLTTITSRVCLDMLRSRQARREDLAGAADEEFGLRAAVGGGAGRPTPAVPSRRRCWPTRSGWRCWSCSTGWLRPSGWRSCCTTCSGCRSRRSRGSPDAHPTPPGSSRAGPATGARRGRAGRRARPAGAGAAARRLARQRAVAEAFIAASRAGDRDALVAVLDPDVVLHADAAAVPTGRPSELRGAAAVANGARLSGQRSRNSVLVLVDGVPGIVYAPGGKVEIVLAFSYRDDRIAGIEVIADAARLDALELSVIG